MFLSGAKDPVCIIYAFSTAYHAAVVMSTFNLCYSTRNHPSVEYICFMLSKNGGCMHYF